MFLDPADLFGWAIVIVGAIWVAGLGLLGVTLYLEGHDGALAVVRGPNPDQPVAIP